MQPRAWDAPCRSLTTPLPPFLTVSLKTKSVAGFGSVRVGGNGVFYIRTLPERSGRLMVLVYQKARGVTVRFLCLLVEDNSLSQKKKVTVDDLFSDELRVHDPEAKWISGESCVL